VRVLATERLRLQAEKAQNQDMVMELSLDGDHILWINYAWENIIGCVPTSYTKMLASLSFSNAYTYSSPLATPALGLATQHCTGVEPVTPFPLARPINLSLIGYALREA